jgi:hypothetical protein
VYVFYFVFKHSQGIFCALNILHSSVRLRGLRDDILMVQTKDWQLSGHSVTLKRTAYVTERCNQRLFQNNVLFCNIKVQRKLQWASYVNKTFCERQFYCLSFFFFSFFQYDHAVKLLSGSVRPGVHFPEWAGIAFQNYVRNDCNSQPSVYLVSTGSFIVAVKPKEIPHPPAIRKSRMCAGLTPQPSPSCLGTQVTQ